MFEHHIVRIGIQQDKICACIFYLFPAQLQVNEFHPVHAPVFIVPVNPRRLAPSPVEADIAKGHFFDPRTRFRVVILVFHHPQIKQLSMLDPFNPDVARLNQMDPRPSGCGSTASKGLAKRGRFRNRPPLISTESFCGPFSLKLIVRPSWLQSTER